MKRILFILLLLPAIVFGQGPHFSQIPHRSSAVSAADYFIGSHYNGNGTYTDYLYSPSSFVADTIVELINSITYPILDSALLTRMNALLILEIKHGGVVSAPLQINSFYRLRDSSGLAVDTFKMANRPLNHTLSGMKMISNVNTYGVAVLQAQGGQKFINGTSYDTIKAIGGTKIFEYLDVDSTWNPIWEYYPLPAINSTVNPPNLVQAVSTASLTGTYSNGANGIGATFTSTGNFHLVVDGYSMNAGDRLLLTAQSPTYQNGVYKVLQTGTASVEPFILVRADNYNAPWNINNTIPIVVQNGSVNAGSTWVLASGVSIGTVGTDAITYARQYTLQQVTSANDTTNKGIFFTRDPDGSYSVYIGPRLNSGPDGSGQILISDTTVLGVKHATISLAASNHTTAASIHGSAGDQTSGPTNDFIITALEADGITSTVVQLGDMHNNKIDIYPSFISFTDATQSSSNTCQIKNDTLTSSRIYSWPDASGTIGVFTDGKGVGITNSATSGVISQSVGKDGSYQVTVIINITTSTAYSFTAICLYTDETNTAKTQTINFSNSAGISNPTIANAGGTERYSGIASVRCKGGTSLSVATAPGGTYTGVVYDIYASCVKIGKQ